MADDDTQSESLENQDLETLESPDNTQISNAAQPADNSDSLEEEPKDNNNTPEASPEKPKKSHNPLRHIRQSLNIYLILLGSILIIAVAVVLIAYKQSQHSSTNNLKTQNLSQSTLNQLADSNSTVGSSQYVLNVESSAIFAGQVILRQSLEVAGNLQVGGTTALNNVTVAGLGQFGQATVNNNLTVGGNSTIQGSATVAKSLQVSGGGSFGGNLSVPQITTNTLDLNGNLILQHHLGISGSTPSRTTGTALGNGGSASISGTDAAGSVSINTGNSPPAGCFVTINFTTPYDSTPHVLITPIGSPAGTLNYYVTRSTTSFSICDASPPPAGSSFGFDYFIVD